MRAAFHTLGCKVNSYETQAVIEQFEGLGFDIVDFTEPADVYVVNTCSVTAMAEHKSRQMLHRAKRLNPDAVIVAAGCYAQRTGGDLLKDAAVDLVIGNNRKSEIAELALKFLKEQRRGRLSETDDLTHCLTYESQHISGAGEKSRAYVKIQDGCNRFCSYCIIPYVRGRSRCRESADILDEVRTLAVNGYKEIVLTGIDISMFTNMADLIRRINDIDGVERIRLGSLEAGMITEDLVSSIAACDKACPQFHLSLQSGCDATLKRMNRHYVTAEFADKAAMIRSHFDTCALTTDVIVGFPGETDEEFEESLTFVKRIAFSHTHVFKYSRREGTVADRMPDQVPESVKSARSACMIAEMDVIKYDFEKAFIGRDRPVLAEEQALTTDGRKVWLGYTPEYVRCAIETEEDVLNRIVTAHITGFTDTENGRILLAGTEHLY